MGLTDKKDKLIAEQVIEIKRLNGKIDELTQTIKEQQQKIVYQQHQIHLFQKALFGTKSEKLVGLNPPGQAALEFVDLPVLTPENESAENIENQDADQADVSSPIAKAKKK